MRLIIFVTPGGNLRKLIVGFKTRILLKDDAIYLSSIPNADPDVSEHWNHFGDIEGPVKFIEDPGPEMLRSARRIA